MAAPNFARPLAGLADDEEPGFAAVKRGGLGARSKALAVSVWERPQNTAVRRQPWPGVLSGRAFLSCHSSLARIALFEATVTANEGEAADTIIWGRRG
jgi:hypothetical protein